MTTIREAAPDLYENPTPCIPTGENSITLNGDGSVSVEHKAPEERPLTRKDAKAVRECDDEMIERMTETSIAEYFRVGKKVTVSRRISGGWLCGTCPGQDRYELDQHKGCAHIQRVKRWVADHPAEIAA